MNYKAIEDCKMGLGDSPSPVFIQNLPYLAGKPKNVANI
ncbi:hypothetical protein CLFO_19540 [Clostridium formicaceticum]|uniref:Uncharacterized protein n=1 Tax=Clostridium formicaceticum TaxID=1497 RepID=A0AAC9WG88_9CLOT|nr:hypothetical protein CLFO_19540 [Clostridium formicaceticum]